MPLVRIAAAIILLLLSAPPGFADGWPPAAADISLTLSRGHGGCLEGNDCRLVLQIENLGSAPFKGGLSVLVETASPSVPGFAASGAWRCERLAYGRMACVASSIELAPAQTFTGLVSVRFLPTHMSEAEACAAIDWRGTSGAAKRDALKSLAAGLGRDAPVSGGLEAVFGAWGEGDLRRGNDRGCVTAAIGPAPADAACPEGENLIAGRCATLDGFCSGNRERDPAGGHCACPDDAPAFHPVSRSCAPAPASACGEGRTAEDGMCFCPADRPLWNADRSRCEEWREPEARAAKLEAPPEPVAKPKARKPAKRLDAPVKKRVIAQPTCGRDETRRGEACVKLVRKPAKRKLNSIRIAQSDPAKPTPRRRLFAKRCPAYLAFCWPRLIREARERRRRAQIR